MQALKLISFAVLVASCVFHVGGFPAEGYREGSKSTASTGYFGYAKDLASRGAGLVGSGVSSGAGMVGSSIASGAGLVGSSIPSGAVGAVGNKLYNISSMVGSGLYTGAGMVGSSLYAGAEMVGNGIANLTGTQFSLERLSKALSTVNVQTLSAALGVPEISKDIANKMPELSKAIADKVPEISKAIFDRMPSIPKAIADKVDIYGILQKVLASQALGGINYETAIVFLERLSVVMPSLRKTVDGFKTVTYVINKVQKLRSEGKPIDSTTLMKEAIDLYFMDVDPDFKKTLIDLSPLVYEAAMGNKDAAWKITAALADRETVIQTLKGMGFKSQIDIIQTVIAQVSEYANLIKATDAAVQQQK